MGRATDRGPVYFLKYLFGVERAFCGLKNESLGTAHLPPQRRRGESAHFLCLLAYHLQWHLLQELEPALFADEVPDRAPPTTPARSSRPGAVKKPKPKRRAGAISTPCEPSSPIWRPLPQHHSSRRQGSRRFPQADRSDPASAQNLQSAQHNTQIHAL